MECRLEEFSAMILSLPFLSGVSCRQHEESHGNKGNLIKVKTDFQSIRHFHEVQQLGQTTILWNGRILPFG